jgi:hypothetical protein
MVNTKSIQEVERLLKFGNFYRQFINNSSRITSLIQKVIMSKTKFKWLDKAQIVFNKLKKQFSEPLIINHYNLHEPAIMETDASDFVILVVLNQRNKENKLHPVAFFSKKLFLQESSFEVRVKEQYAIMCIITK